ncbi:hypothetical protein HDU97_004717 [Phlyctochytrium planicorne]|nr:hypothetical protein HDU97_004717 [Phlyctochytrium planicorne]
MGEITAAVGDSTLPSLVPPAQPYGIRAISASQNTYYMIDDSGWLWMRPMSDSATSPWKLTPFPHQNGAKAVAMSIYGNNIAIAQTSITPDTLQGSTIPPQSWTSLFPGKYDIFAASGNIQGNLWLITDKNRLLRSWSTSRSFSNGLEDSVEALSVRGKVFFLTKGQICSYDLNGSQTSRICNSRLASPKNIAASDDNLFAVDRSGKLFSTRLPLTTDSTFFDTGFAARGDPRALAVPLDGRNPIVVDYDSTVYDSICGQNVHCFDNPSAQNPSTPNNPNDPSQPPSQPQSPGSPNSPQQTNPVQQPSSPQPGTPNSPSSQIMPNQPAPISQGSVSATFAPRESSASTAGANNESTDWSSTVKIAGIVGGVVGVVLLVLVVVVVRVARRSRRGVEKKDAGDLEERDEFEDGDGDADDEGEGEGVGEVVDGPVAVGAGLPRPRMEAQQTMFFSSLTIQFVDDGGEGEAGNGEGEVKSGAGSGDEPPGYNESVGFGPEGGKGKEDKGERNDDESAREAAVQGDEGAVIEVEEVNEVDEGEEKHKE